MKTPLWKILYNLFLNANLLINTILGYFIQLQYFFIKKLFSFSCRNKVIRQNLAMFSHIFAHPIWTYTTCSRSLARFFTIAAITHKFIIRQIGYFFLILLLCLLFLFLNFDIIVVLKIRLTTILHIVIGSLLTELISGYRLSTSHWINRIIKLFLLMTSFFTVKLS